jgi:lipoprotein-anchoring transpeptidase ErfK/SrfK
VQEGAEGSGGLTRKGWTTAADAVGEARTPWRRALRLAVAGFTALLIGIIGAVGYIGYETYAFAQEIGDRLLPGTSINGIDVSGMTVPEARTAVEAQLDGYLDHVVEVTATGPDGPLVWPVSRRGLGVTTDLDAQLAQAESLTRDPSWLSLAGMRWNGEAPGMDLTVTVTHVEEPLTRLVQEIAAGLDQPAVDAALSWDTGWVSFQEPVPGRVVDVEESVQRIRQALGESTGSVPLQVAELPAQPLPEEDSQILLVRQSEHRLHLFTDGELTRTWTVTTGTGRYPTPTGVFEVEAKRYMPTWYNPAPTGWGADMPAQIGPGPGNPLGVRALNWSGGGAIRFHGTARLHELGSDASKGCVRLSNADVIELYDLVEIGTRIVSVR